MEIVVPEKLKDMKRAALFKQFTKIDSLSLLQDNLTAAKLQMTNLLRSRGLDILRSVSAADVTKKRQLAQIFSSFFADTPSLDFFALYGALSKVQATTDILKQHQDTLITRWDACLKSAKNTTGRSKQANSRNKNYTRGFKINTGPTYSIRKNGLTR